MLFNSFSYLLLLSLVVPIYWLLPGRFRVVLLIAASYVFYMSWKAGYGFLLLGLTLGNYVVGLCVAKVQTKAAKRLWLIGGIATNLGMLAIFKYTNFIIDCLWSVRNLGEGLLHSPAAAPLLPIILPLGISFFVFEFIHYLTDVYRGNAPIKNVLRFGLFAAFFPSQIAGPIKRFEDFDQQARTHTKFDLAMFEQGLRLIVVGMFKKVAIGDNLAPLVNAGFANAAVLSTGDAWLSVLAFSMQIYYDFSGYTDIGRGSAMLLGYRLPENFNMPYLAKSASEFWHRWHMSLSTWLRDYLYIPMGGSRAGKFFQMRNLLITMLLGGLWHGASWTYVLWGAFHGLGLIVDHTWQSVSQKMPIFKRPALVPLWNVASWGTTMLFVMAGWVMFRAKDTVEARAMYQALMGLNHQVAGADVSITSLFVNSVLPGALLVYGVGFLALRFGGITFGANSARWWQAPPFAARLVALAAICYLILGLTPSQSVPFIYFQF